MIYGLHSAVLRSFTQMCNARKAINMKTMLILALLGILVSGCWVCEEAVVPTTTIPPDPDFIAMANETALEKSAAEQVMKLASDVGTELEDYLCVEVPKFNNKKLTKELRSDLEHDNELPNQPEKVSIKHVLFCGKEYGELAVGLDEHGNLVATYNGSTLKPQPDP